MANRIAHFVIKFRMAVLVGIIILTGIFVLQIKELKMITYFGDLLPQNHPYIKIHNEFREKFGGATIVLLSLTVKKGDIFNVQTLSKIQRITREIDLIPGVNHNQVISLAHRKAKNIKATSWGIQAEPVMWPELPQTPEEIEKLKDIVHHDNSIYGYLTSHDDKAALIVAELFEEKIDYSLVFKKIEEIITKEEDSNTKIYAVGQPVLTGWLYHYYPQTLKIFIISLFLMLIILFIYTKSLVGTIIPLLVALVSAIWGLGFSGLMGYNLDPLILVLPVLVISRAISHSVQMLERHSEEFERLGNTKEACIASLGGLLLPGSVAIITDSIGIFIIALAPIPLMQKVGYFCGFWALALIPTVLILNPLVLSFIPAPKTRKRDKGMFASIFEINLLRLGDFIIKRDRGILIVIIPLIVMSIYFSRNIIIGDIMPGSSLVWPDSEYNISSKVINEKFPGADQLLVIIKGEEAEAIKHPDVQKYIEEFQRFMELDPLVGGSTSIVDLLREVNMRLHEDDPKWLGIPKNQRDVGVALFVLFSGMEPGDLDKFVDPESKNASVTIYYKDHRGSTIKSAILRAKKFKETHPNNSVGLTLAGGLIGVLAATNEAIANSTEWITIWIFSITFLLCVMTYRSLWGGLFLVISLGISHFLTLSYMSLKGIGLNISTLSISSVGIGLGVDYGLYLLSRIKEEYAISKDLEIAIKRGLTTAGKAIVFTATTMLASTIPWYFISDIRFQAEMGLLLGLLMLLNMFGALTIVPGLVSWFKPKFILKG